MKAIWAWIVQAAKDIYTFAYTEIGLILSFLKVPDKSKFSAKRLIAVALAADAIISGVPHDLWTLIVVLAKILVAGGLMVLAELTKT